MVSAKKHYLIRESWWSLVALGNLAYVYEKIGDQKKAAELQEKFDALRRKD